MDVSKGIPLATTSRSIAGSNLPLIKSSANFAHELKVAAEGLRKAEEVERGIGRLDADNAPHNAANVVMKGDQLVATIYKSGAVEFTDAYAAQLKNLNLPGNNAGDLGSLRAEIIAKAVGGEVMDANTSSSASWQSRFSAKA